MNPLDKAYQPQEIEKNCYAAWEAKGYFAPSDAKDAYCIIFPPPNVTGSLHMGHGFGATLMDVLIRYHRMLGQKTLWQTGTDHAGIATQMVVERKLNAQGETRHSIGREAFIKKIWEWKQESGDQIAKQLRRLGASMDWDHACFTMDEGPSYAVREVFIRLYEEGLIYKGKRLVNWDPVLLTAISDLEVVNQEEEGKLWYIRYPLVDRKDFLVVATTRPETLFGDVAVAVHPDDERYQALIGTHVQLPLTERTIPIIADDSVDPEFGTGCVKITPAHDFNDYAIGARHQLSPINMLTPTAHLNEEVPLAYQGLSRFEAREKVLEDLKALNLIEKIDAHQLKVPRGDRSGAVIEPYLTYQWYVKSKPLAEPAIQAVKQGDIKFIPENWDKTYFQWMNNIEDWCISRQLWWGHRIPVWYDEKGKAYVGHDEADVHARHQLNADVQLSQDEDVLDTWFSSALWPLSSLGWPLQTEKLNAFFPTQVLVTGFDIIFFWVARMIMMSLKFTGKTPFQHVYITGLIRDAEGHKMSKSKGNVLDPIDLIDGIDLDALIQKRTYGLMQPKMAAKIEAATRKEFKEGIPAYGTDALRFTFCSVATFTRDIRFDTNRLGGYRNFCNKLWNAARYVMMNTEGHDIPDKVNHAHLSLPDRWILSRLQDTIQQSHEALAQYRFDFFSQLLYDFIWNEFCDWYLELSKPILLSKETSPEIANGTRYTLIHVLETLLRLLHPIMPFITEALWQRVALLAHVKGESIMLAAYPQMDASLKDDQAVKALEWIKLFITAIRTIRSEMNISPAKSISILLKKGLPFDHQQIEHHQHFLKVLAKIESITWLTADEAPPFAASAFLGELEIFIPMAGLINKDEELARLDKEMMKIEKDMMLTDKKLSNPQFVEKAPPDVITKEKTHYAELKALYEKLKTQRLHLAELS